MRLRYLALATLALPVLALTTACGDDEESTPDSADGAQTGETVDVDLTMEDFSFDPGTIDINLGDEVFVELANDGDTDHTFTVSEFFVDEELSSGEDRDVSFTPNEPGEFTYFCRIHPEQMQGSLRVLTAGAAAPTETPDDSDGGGAGVGY